MIDYRGLFNIICNGIDFTSIISGIGNMRVTEVTDSKSNVVTISVWVENRVIFWTSGVVVDELGKNLLYMKLAIEVMCYGVMIKYKNGND